MNNREGHRPYLTPQQAMHIAREMFGVNMRDVADGRPLAEARCVELPSYDDRNFKIVGRMQCAPDEQTHQQPQALQHCLDNAPSPASSNRQAPQSCKVWDEVVVVLKIHNTQDSCSAAELQMIDEAMLRLRAAGVLTNLPLAPLAATDVSAAPTAGAIRPAVAATVSAAVAAAPNEPAPVEASVETSVETSVEASSGFADVKTPPFPAGPAASMASLGSNAAEPTSATVPCILAKDPTAASSDCARVSEARPVSTELPLCCWAWLPCTCHPPQPQPAGTLNKAAAEAEETAPGTGGSEQKVATSPPNAPKAGLGDEAEKEASTRRLQESGEGTSLSQPSSVPHQLHHWHIVRCLTYVPGRMLSSVQCLTPELLLSLGRLMGRVTRALAGWAPPALAARRFHDWYPENGAAVLRRLVPGIAAFDTQQKSLLLEVASDLTKAAPNLAESGPLPRQVCHADANDDNCVISEDGRQVVGLIDFGDMAVMPRVCEVAISMLYTMLLALNHPMGHVLPTAERSKVETEQVPKMALDEVNDANVLHWVLTVAGMVLAGYQAVVPLQPGELAVLPLLLRGRLAQSLALGAASVVADPGNAAYLLMTQRPGWRLIRLLTPSSYITEGRLLEGLLTAAWACEAPREAVAQEGVWGAAAACGNPGL